MQDGPQKTWARWLLERFGHLKQLDVADVGCGTGQLTVRLAPHCRQIYGIDISEDMLSQAAAAAMAANVRVQWLCQPAQSLRLPTPVDVVVASCDVLNYLVNEGDLEAAVQSVARALRTGGWFCFDILGPARLAALQAGGWHDVREEAVVVVDTDINEEGIITYEVELFTQVSGRRYERATEIHRQRAIPWPQLRDVLEREGFEVVECVGDFGANEVAHADRVCVLSRRTGL